jgi:hypothetical protein
MTEEEKRALYERSVELLRQTEGIEEQLEARRQLNSERAGEWQAPEPDPIAHPFTRPPRARDWHGEQRWIEQIIAARLAAWPDAIGQAIAKTTTALRREFEQQIEVLRTEVFEECLKTIREVSTQGLEARLAKLDLLLERLEHSDDELARAAPPILTKH